MIYRAVATCGEAQPIMHYALGRNNSGVKKTSDGVSCSTSRKFLALNDQSSLKDHELSAVMWWNSHQRFFSLTSIALQSDSFQTFTPYISDNSSHQVSGANVKMDGLCMFSPQPAVSFQVGTETSHAPNSSCSSRSLRTKSKDSRTCRISKTTSLLTGQTKTKTKTKTKKSSGNPKQKAFIINGSSYLLHDDSNATSSGYCVKDTVKADNPAKRSSRKKGKRKVKQLKKNSCSNTSPGPEILGEVDVHVNSVYKINDNNVPPMGGGPITLTNLIENGKETTAPSHTICFDTNEVKENGYDAIHSAIHGTHTSYSISIDEPDIVLSSEHVTGDDIVVSSTNSLRPTDQVLSTFNREVVDTYLGQPSYCKNSSVEVFTDMHRSLMLDSLSDGWNTDDCTSAGDCTDELSSNREDSLSQSSEYLHHTSSTGPGNRKRYLLHGDYSRDVNDDKNAERLRKNGGLSSIVGKRAQQVGELAGRSIGGVRFSNGRNVLGRTGKEKGHPVWKMVQKDNGNKVIQEPVNETLILTHKGVLDVNNLDLSLNSNDENKKLEGKVTEKLKRKSSTGPKDNISHRKGPHSGKINVVRHKKSNMRQKEASGVPPYQVSTHKSFSNGSGAHCAVGGQRIKIGETESVDSSPSVPVQNSRVSFNDIRPFESGSARFVKNFQTAPNQSKRLSKSSASLEPKHVVEEQDWQDLPASRYLKVEAKVSYPQNGKQEHTSGGVMKKWVPILRKGAEVNGMSRSDYLLTLPVDEPFESRLVNTTEGRETTSKSHCSIASIDSTDEFIGSSCSIVNHSPSKDEVQMDSTRCNDTSRSGDSSITLGEVNCHLNQKSQTHYGSVSEAGSSKIGKAVSDAYRVQLTSEGVQRVTGCPLAEFERLLDSASPVLCQSHQIGCKLCSRDQTILCKHEIPDVSLGSLWRWYEKHGSYGLEVKADDYQSFTRMGIDSFEFRAYFVPFLSAVQLFKNCSSHSVDTSGSSNGEGVNSKDSSSIGYLSFLPAIVPRTKEDVSTSEYSPLSAQDDVSNNSLVIGKMDAELIFEYFESEQPQQRRPLFEKIEELVRGDGPSSNQAYGDSTKLDSLDLRDLHPSSWYSVSWYPIYRIPDGNFRAAFLTYHSLGHLVNRITPSDITGEGSCVVSPVIGLQSYKAQEECWFQLKHLKTVSTEDETSHWLNRSETLRERLDTLQTAASVMARTVVNRGNVKFVNRQPDYEFFLSRQRW